MTEYDFTVQPSAEGGGFDVIWPPRDPERDEWDEAVAAKVAYFERQRRRHVLGWKVVLLVALVLGALLMVAVVSHG